MDARHKKRMEIVQELYSSMYHRNSSYSKTTLDILDHLEQLDGHIAQAAPKYDVQKIAKVDLSILRLAVYELIINKTQPEKVVINEAIELAKELAGTKSPSFVNAVLGAILDHEQPAQSD